MSHGAKHKTPILPPYREPLIPLISLNLLVYSNDALPVVTKPADGRGPVFELEARACGIYALAFPDPAQRRGDMDYKATPFVLK